MARITAGITTSHVPAIGAAIDNGRTAEPYWAPLFAGYERSKAWIAVAAISSVMATVSIDAASRN